jgi:hypothetical protein
VAAARRTRRVRRIRRIRRIRRVRRIRRKRRAKGVKRIRRIKAVAVVDCSFRRFLGRRRARRAALGEAMLSVGRSGAMPCKMAELRRGYEAGGIPRSRTLADYSFP